MTTDLAFAALAAVVAICAASISAMRAALRDKDRRISELQSAADAERRLSATGAAQLDAVLSASEDAILLIDSGGVCRRLSPYARTLFKNLPDDLTLLGMTQSAELDLLLQQAQQRPGSDQLVSGEVVLRAFGERAMQVLIGRINAGFASGGDRHYLVVLRDVTDLRRLETVRRDFVANVSHELRTPLTSIKAMAETLLGGAADDPAVAPHFLDTIVEETDRLVRLAADLLDLSRIEARPVLKEDHDIADLIDDALTRLSGQRDKAMLGVTVDIERPLIVPCDADEVSQVLLNLVDNAIKYTPRGGRIAVAAHLRKGRVVVEISDTGIGILQQDLPRLFERFYRTDKARGRQSGGTGLGLSIVKHIIERHGGELWVRSEYNRGSAFGFSLPRPTGSASLSARIDRLYSEWPPTRRGEYVAVGDSPTVEAAAAGIRTPKT